MSIVPSGLLFLTLSCSANCGLQVTCVTLHAPPLQFPLPSSTKSTRLRAWYDIENARQHWNRTRMLRFKGTMPTGVFLPVQMADSQPWPPPPPRVAGQGKEGALSSPVFMTIMEPHQCKVPSKPSSFPPSRWPTHLLISLQPPAPHHPPGVFLDAYQLSLLHTSNMLHDGFSGLSWPLVSCASSRAQRLPRPH